MRIKIEKKDRKRKEKKKRETSKTILLVLFICSFAFILFNMYLSLMTQDTSVMRETTEGLFKLLSVSVGFYYWKAKNENIRKHNKKIKEEKKEEEEEYDDYR